MYAFEGASGQGTFVLSLALITFIWLCLVLKTAYLTPLRAIPGPWYAKYTHLWLKWNVLAGRRMHYLHDLHKKYGPIVRTAPLEVDVADLAAFNEIHRVAGGYWKSPWYLTFREGKFHDILALLLPREHAERRKLFAQAFSVTSLRTNWEKDIEGKVELAVSKIKADALRGEADIYKWWTCMTTDVISLLSFGESLNMLENNDRNDFIENTEVALQLAGKRSEMPIFYTILKLLPFKFAKDMLSAGERANEYGRQAVARTRADPLGRSTVFAKMVNESGTEGAILTEEDVALEAGGFIVAGSGTTAVTLTYLVYSVLSNPAVQALLEEEVSTLPDKFDESLLERLPYLSAVIDETLRLYCAAPGSLPRSVPKGGATLGGYFIPEDVTVCTQAYTIHRNPAIYPEPDSFIPERFISEGRYTPPKTAFCPFGGSSRICLGLHLARMELRHGAAHFFRECKGAKLAPSTTKESMHMVNYFLITPAAARCNITLK